MAAGYSHTTRSTGTVLTDTIYNADHNNHITNMIPSVIDDYSANATTMRATTDPYPGAVVSLSTTLAGELERIRYVIEQITGETYWYQDPPTFCENSVSYDHGTYNFTTGGQYIIDVDGTAEGAAGALTLGAGGDAGVFFDGTNLVLISNGAGASGIVLDSEDDTVEILGSGTLQATFDTGGLDLVTGDEFSINSTSVLNATTLGTGVVASSLTSVGTLTTLTVDDITVNGNTISSSGASTLAINPTAGQSITFDSTVTLDAGVVASLTSLGIGIASPEALLTVKQTVDTGEGGISIGAVTGANNRFQIYVDSNDDLSFRWAASGATPIRVDEGGSVGIGTSATPTSARLEVNQSVSDGSDAIPVIMLTQADVSEEMIQMTSTAGVGNAIEDVGAKSLTTTVFIKCTVNGSTVYIPAGTIA